MAFGFLKKKVEDVPQKKNYLDIPENMYDAPFEKIINCMDPKYLEDAVDSNFDKIILSRKSDELRFFKMYHSWHKIFLQHFNEILVHFAEEGSYADFQNIINYYPELAPDVYEFLLKEYIWDFGSPVGKALDVINDVLIPMSDIERYQDQVYHHRFDIVREFAEDIISATNYYSEMWDLFQVFEQYFDISREYFSDIIHEQIETEILYTFKKSNFVPTYDCDSPFIYEECETIVDIFKDRESYELVMNELPKIMAKGGLGIYQVFTTVLGNNAEVEDARTFCPEFITDEQFPHLVGDEVVVTCYADEDYNEISFIGKIRSVKHRGITIVS